jgi:hypothetical protein
VDRELARRSVLRGLALAGLGALIFGLTFVLAVFYIA